MKNQCNAFQGVDVEQFNVANAPANMANGTGVPPAETTEAQQQPSEPEQQPQQDLNEDERPWKRRKLNDGVKEDMPPANLETEERLEDEGEDDNNMVTTTTTTSAEAAAAASGEVSVDAMEVEGAQVPAPEGSMQEAAEMDVTDGNADNTTAAGTDTLGGFSDGGGPALAVATPQDGAML